MNLKATLHKGQRLKSRKQIDTLFKSGTAINVFPFRAIVLIEEWGDTAHTLLLQAGFSVSAKKFKNAVDRNRIKRLTREAYRVQKHVLEQHLQQKAQRALLFFIYTGKEIPAFKLVQEKLGVILNKLVQSAGEKNSSNT